MNALDVGASVHSATSDQLEQFADGADCNCPDNCQETSYTTELSQIPLRPDGPIMLKVIAPAGMPLQC